MILVKINLASNQVDPVDMSDMCCVDIQISNKKYRLICIYRPPVVSQASLTDADLLCLALTKLLDGSYYLFVAVDLNLPNINCNLSTAPNDGVHDLLLNVFVDNCLHQMVSVPMRQNNILDIFLTNCSQFIFDCVIKDSFGGSDHQSVLLEFCISQTSTAHTLLKPVDIMHKFIVWESASIDHVHEYLYAYNWTDLFNVNSSPEELWSNFCTVLNVCISSTARIIHTRPHTQKGRHNPILRRLFTLIDKV